LTSGEPLLGEPQPAKTGSETSTKASKHAATKRFLRPSGCFLGEGYRQATENPISSFPYFSLRCPLGMGMSGRRVRSASLQKRLALSVASTCSR
jgi:hypothetical protein